MCIRPITMYDVGINTETGKRRLVAKRPNNNALYQYREVLVPCGKCDACLESKRWDWCLRLQIELKSSPSATFVTLTYDNDHLPSDNKPRKDDVQRFLKRLRNVPRDFGIDFETPLRYYIASEHGEKSGRVHYHGIIYGVDMFDPRWRPVLHHFDSSNYPVYISPLLARLWSNGYCTIGRCNASSIRYISDYIYGDPDSIRLYSIGLGVPYFCKYGRVRGRLVPVDLLPSGRQAAVNGFITVGSLDHVRKVPPPRCLRRYLDRFDADLAAVYSADRLALARDLSYQSLAPHLVEEHYQTNKNEQKRKKKL